MSVALLLSALLSLSLVSASPVLDINGQPLLPKTNYYILPVLRGRGGGLSDAPLSNTICPLYVAQERLEVNDGLPVEIHPVNTSATTVELSTDANFVFSVATICVQSMVWSSENVRGVRLVGLSGSLGNPGGETISNWFKVERSGNNYKLVFCPTVCNTCRPACGDLRVVVSGRERYLVIGRGSPFPVMFKKA